MEEKGAHARDGGNGSFHIKLMKLYIFNNEQTIQTENEREQGDGSKRELEERS